MTLRAYSVVVEIQTAGGTLKKRYQTDKIIFCDFEPQVGLNIDLSLSANLSLRVAEIDSQAQHHAGYQCLIVYFSHPQAQVCAEG